ncbi:hypothetical protein HG530_012496 [Fusarium avenaceum]|nr:hypothetical protein HG530_012496 [Fusarium avenaceum]
MTKAASVLFVLIGSAIAQISRTCVDIAFDPKINVLSARCQPRDNSGYLPSGLDLNQCFGYDGTEITPTYHGNFGTSCGDCELFIAPDPFYGGAIYWIKCTCKGQTGKISVPLEDAVAHEYVSNKNGRLLC